MARMSDIMRADELKAAKDVYDLWLKKSRADKQIAYNLAVGDHKRLNRSSRVGYVQPFGAPDNFWYETKVLAPASETPAPNTKEENDTALITALLTAVAPSATTGYVLGTAPTAANNVSAEARKIQFAKVRLTERTGTGQPGKLSRLTGLPYTKYATNTVSCPFGVNSTSTDKSEQAAQKVLKNALKGANKSIGFTPQGDVGNIVIIAPPVGP